MIEAFLDIETTGLSPDSSKITVIGIHLVENGKERFIQLVGDEISQESLMQALEGVETLHTYNGSRFDLPFIQAHLGVDLAQEFTHCDLMFDCWQNNLYGGLKRVEQTLGIPRKLTDINGLQAVRLWWRYENDYDEEALKTLCEYNREDAVNLKVLKEKVSGKRGVKPSLRLTPEAREEKVETYGRAYSRVIETLKGIPKEARDFKPSAKDWSIHEIIIHLADSEANAYVRFRRFIAEPGSRVMAYDQERWAKKLDYSSQNGGLALQLFKYLRSTTYALMKDLSENTWANTVEHSENGVMTLESWLETYAEHAEAHVAQIRDNLNQWRKLKH